MEYLDTFFVALRDATKTPFVTLVSRRGSTSDKARLLFVLSPERRPCWLILKNSIYDVEDNLLGSPRPCYASRSLTIEPIRAQYVITPYCTIFNHFKYRDTSTNIDSFSNIAFFLVPFLGTYPPKQSQADVWSEFRILADPPTHEATKKKRDRENVHLTFCYSTLSPYSPLPMLVTTPLIGRSQTPGQQTRP